MLKKPVCPKSPQGGMTWDSQQNQLDFEQLHGLQLLGTAIIFLEKH